MAGHRAKGLEKEGLLSCERIRCAPKGTGLAHLSAHAATYPQAQVQKADGKTWRVT